jgi:hypothetical protein
MKGGAGLRCACRTRAALIAGFGPCSLRSWGCALLAALPRRIHPQLTPRAGFIVCRLYEKVFWQGELFLRGTPSICFSR